MIDFFPTDFEIVRERIIIIKSIYFFEKYDYLAQLDHEGHQQCNLPFALKTWHRSSTTRARVNGLSIESVYRRRFTRHKGQQLNRIFSIVKLNFL